MGRSHKDAAAVDNRLGFVSAELEQFPDFKQIYEQSKSGDDFGDIGHPAARAFLLMLQEKEIFVFALLQWIAIGLVYLLWTQILAWIPMSVWESDVKIFDLPLNLAFFAWNLACVGLAAFPVGILSGAMVAAHLLRSAGRESTLAACLQLGWRAAWPLWIFHWIDGWITVDRILERLPKRGYGKSLAWLAATEVLYYAWKTGTMAIVPAIISGKGLIDGGKCSLEFVKNNLKQAIVLRGGYTAVNWVVGIGSYIATVIFLHKMNVFEAEHEVYAAYLWAGIPIVVSLAVLMLFVRPVFMLATAQAYIEHLQRMDRDLELPQGPSRGMSVLVAFSILCLVVLVTFMYREELGLMKVLTVDYSGRS